MIVKLLTEHHLEFLRLKGGYTGSSESILVKMPNWKSHVTVHISSGENFLTSIYTKFFKCLGTSNHILCASKASGNNRRYSVLFTVESLSLLYLLVIS